MLEKSYIDQGNNATSFRRKFLETLEKAWLNNPDPKGMVSIQDIIKNIKKNWDDPKIVESTINSLISEGKIHAVFVGEGVNEEILAQITEKGRKELNGTFYISSTMLN